MVDIKDWQSICELRQHLITHIKEQKLLQHSHVAISIEDLEILLRTDFTFTVDVEMGEPWAEDLAQLLLNWRGKLTVSRARFEHNVEKVCGGAADMTRSTDGKYTVDMIEFAWQVMRSFNGEKGIYRKERV